MYGFYFECKKVQNLKCWYSNLIYALLPIAFNIQANWFKNIRQRLEGKLVKKVEKGYTRDNLK